MVERLKLANVELPPEQLEQYIQSPDDLGEVEKGTAIPTGYKRCGSCGHAKKFYLFNKNSGSKNNCTGNCKACQKATASRSYAKTKQKRNYKKYYQENKEIKQQHARKYYQENKERVKERHKEYLQTKKGKKVMQKAHAKRRKALAENKGIPYTRAMVIERDGTFQGLQQPVCYLCNKPIVDISGKSLHLDHVVPVIMGGLDCFTNIASSHHLCNLKREKDARELTTEQVQAVIELSEKYMDAHPDLFED